ncbi:hypothetical protein [Streptomyces alkaliphilus]|uniref:Uncharacterized protein n=1 Tax=Streptomyces alkaliphilus TaxID=1472722 RepID=A0A7W3TE29_9ACTN|nr:hypothetical protein [Streptomyces alkaliphilus]MBB0244830.1 hypothetical protein [Streptomyces alkaliphilus]MQS08182.1 hypothetical protein [Streptomyces alkaliphilus]
MGTEPHGEERGRRDEWDELVLDESFVRDARVNEPTARTRMLSERWKNNAPDPQPWRSDEPPAGWIHSTAPGRGKKRKERAPRKPRRGITGWFRRRRKDEGNGPDAGE